VLFGIRMASTGVNVRFQASKQNEDEHPKNRLQTQSESQHRSTHNIQQPPSPQRIERRNKLRTSRSTSHISPANLESVSI
jgi:hypothetical protein